MTTYKIITSSNKNSLQRIVNDYLELNDEPGDHLWMPQGGVMYDADTRTWAQALIRTSK